jgi:hypothetical protein
MKRLLYHLPLLLLCACASHRPKPAPTVASEPVAPSVVRPDSTVVTPHRTLLDKVLNRPAVSDIHVGNMPAKIGKKATVNVYYGPATISTVGKKATAATAAGATATAIGKAKGPTAIGDSATATDNTKAGQRGGAAATAQGATATATTIKPPIPWLKYALCLGGLGVAYWLLLGGGGTLLLALWRKNKKSDTPTV